MNLLLILFSLPLYAMTSFIDGFNLQPGEEVEKNSLFWECNRLYEDYKQYALVENEYQIPKNIHFIWLGSPLPKKCAEFIQSWRLFHPDWNIKIWTDKDVAALNLINKVAYRKASNWGQKSDILRLEILYRYGGVYVDTDFECLSSFDELHKSCQFYAGVSRDGTAVFNGLMGAKVGHPILYESILQLKTVPNQRDFHKIMEETGPYYLGRMVERYALTCPKGSVVIFPPIFFYPFPGTCRNDESKVPSEFRVDETMAIHYWSCSWQKKS